MPKGPKGEQRPADVVGCAVTVAKIATGEIEDTQQTQPARARSGRARAAALTPKRRKEIARQAAEARWAKVTPHGAP